MNALANTFTHSILLTGEVEFQLTFFDFRCVRFDYFLSLGAAWWGDEADAEQTVRRIQEVLA